MNWSNLQKNKCPSCGGDFLKTIDLNAGKDYIGCKCGFKITKEEYQKIVIDRISKSFNKNSVNEEELI